MHTQNKYPWLKHIDFLIVDLIALLISFNVAFLIKFHGFWFVKSEIWSTVVWTRLIFLITAADVLFTFAMNSYGKIFKRRYYMEIIQAFRLTIYNSISVAMILYIFKRGEDYSRTVFILTYVFYFMLSLIMKYMWKKLIVSGKIKITPKKTSTLFVIAEKNNIDAILANINSEASDSFEVKGMYLTDNTELTEYREITVINSDFADHIIKNNITDVLLAVPPSSIKTEDYRKLIENAVGVHISVESTVGMQTEDQFVSNVGIYKTLSVGAFTFSLSQLMYLVLKRMLDILFGLIVLVMLIPIIFFIKISYLLSGDKADIFYTQNRIGKNGKNIKILKFRTMVPNADKKLAELLKDEKYRSEWELNQKLTNDPRITKVGAFLRKTSIDELPQAINLLKGDMSLVGPRPLIEGELEAHNGLKLYQRVKPGITGWWACNGRSNIDYRQRLELEYYYIKHFSIYIDILCVIRTIFAVIFGYGAE